jgi:succinyl-CoA synthetase beta subunit/citryl-CoA synthetase large subunit
MLFSDMGGIDIEEVAEEHPDHVGRGHLSNLLPFSDFEAKQVDRRDRRSAARSSTARRRSSPASPRLFRDAT